VGGETHAKNLCFPFESEHRDPVIPGSHFNRYQSALLSIVVGRVLVGVGEPHTAERAAPKCADERKRYRRIFGGESGYDGPCLERSRRVYARRIIVVPR
jgi:hypothetical protein